MRKAFCDALIARAADARFIVLTGDVGFGVLEPLRAALGDRFINAGLSEQNMIGVAAALAAQDFDVWVYSIAPFCYARPFEQIRNDLSFHGLPVKLVGNGGGYGYGVMGPTHHAIEDYGVLLTLDHLAVFAPAFDTDVGQAVDAAAEWHGPAYLRLGIDAAPLNFQAPAYSAWRQIISGGGPAVVAFGAIGGSYVETFAALPQDRRPNLWVLSELPLERHALPVELVEQLHVRPELYVIEEHVRQGGVASQLALALIGSRIEIARFESLHARAHDFGRYGSQEYMRRASGLDPQSVLQSLR